jgi:hypothetical protein
MVKGSASYDQYLFWCALQNNVNQIFPEKIFGPPGRRLLEKVSFSAAC